MTTQTSLPEPFPASKAWVLDNPLMRALASGTVRRLGIKPGMRVLDVGCGPGRITLPVARLLGDHGEVLAMDVQRPMLDIVERHAAAEGLQNVRTLLAAAGSADLPPEDRDVALLCFVLGEIPPERRQAAVHEIAQTLRPGGLLAVGEAVFDPHRQRPAAVVALVEAEGLRLVRHDRTLATSVLEFRKAAG